MSVDVIDSTPVSSEGHCPLDWPRRARVQMAVESFMVGLESLGESWLVTTILSDILLFKICDQTRLDQG